MIRAFKPSDMEPVLQIWLDASIQAHHFIPKQFWESRMNDMRNIYVPSGETYVYLEENNILGFMSLMENTLAALFVVPEQQGKGIGKQLMAKAKLLRQDLVLTVYKENQNSIEFYKKCGFVIVKEQIDVHTAHPELVMRYP